MDGVLPVPDVYFRPTTSADLDRIAELEAASYPDDEAASPEALRFRLTNAGELFLTAVKEGYGVAGYVCGTLTNQDRLTHESMQTHDADGTVLCIHSVCVSSELRRRKIGLRLLKAYISTVKLSSPQVRSIRLICKPYLVHFYELAGFKVEGPSDIVHGKDQWIECALDLKC